MKIKKLALLLSLLLSFSAYATAISQADLDNVNAFIETMIPTDDDNVEVKITSANRLDNGKLSSIEVLATDEYLSFGGSIKLNNKNVQMGLSLSGNSKELLGSDPEGTFRTMIVDLIREYINISAKTPKERQVQNSSKEIERIHYQWIRDYNNLIIDPKRHRDTDRPNHDVGKRLRRNGQGLVCLSLGLRPHMPRQIKKDAHTTRALPPPASQTQDRQSRASHLLCLHFHCHHRHH